MLLPLRLLLAAEVALPQGWLYLVCLSEQQACPLPVAQTLQEVQ